MFCAVTNTEGLMSCSLLLSAVLVMMQQPAARTVSTRPIGPGTLEVVAALVGEEMEIKPLPLFELRILRSSDTTYADSLRTLLDGHANHSLAPGSYVLRSRRPATLKGIS